MKAPGVGRNGGQGTAAVFFWGRGSLAYSAVGSLGGGGAS
jgi:hypothetical protein